MCQCKRKYPFGSSLTSPIGTAPWIRPKKALTFPRMLSSGSQLIWLVEVGWKKLVMASTFALSFFSSHFFSSHDISSPVNELVYELRRLDRWRVKFSVASTKSSIWRLNSVRYCLTSSLVYRSVYCLVYGFTCLLQFCGNFEAVILMSLELFAFPHQKVTNARNTLYLSRTKQTWTCASNTHAFLWSADFPSSFDPSLTVG